MKRGDANGMARINVRLADDVMYHSLSASAFRTSKRFCANNVVFKIVDIYKDLLRKHGIV